jgi:hypothetical protein
MLNHEALRIGRLALRWPSAVSFHFSIFGLLGKFMHCITARAFRLDALATIAEGWFAHDAPLLQEQRSHFFVERLAGGRDLISDRGFLEMLSRMRDEYDSLPEDDGPYHVEKFPWDYAAPERELLLPGSQPQFRNVKFDEIDPDAEDLIVELCSGKWA